MGQRGEDRPVAAGGIVTNQLRLQRARGGLQGRVSGSIGQPGRLEGPGVKVSRLEDGTEAGFRLCGDLAESRSREERGEGKDANQPEAPTNSCRGHVETSLMIASDFQSGIARNMY